MSVDETKKDTEDIRRSEGEGQAPEFSKMSEEELTVFKSKAKPEELEAYRQFLSKDVEGLEKKKQDFVEDVSKLRVERRSLIGEDNKGGEKPKEDPLIELKDTNQKIVFDWLYAQFPELNPLEDIGNKKFSQVKRFIPSDFNVLNIEQAKKDIVSAYTAAFPEKAIETAKKLGQIEERKSQFKQKLSDIGGFGGGNSSAEIPDDEKPSKEDQLAAAKVGMTTEKYIEGKKMGWNFEMEPKKS